MAPIRARWREMMRKSSWMLPLLLGALAWGAPAWAEVPDEAWNAANGELVVVRNPAGQQIKGRLVQVTAEVVKVHRADNKVVVIPRSQVAELFLLDEDGTQRPVLQPVEEVEEVEDLVEIQPQSKEDMEELEFDLEPEPEPIEVEPEPVVEVEPEPVVEVEPVVEPEPVVEVQPEISPEPEGERHGEAQTDGQRHGEAQTDGQRHGEEQPTGPSRPSTEVAPPEPAAEPHVELAADINPVTGEPRGSFDDGYLSGRSQAELTPSYLPAGVALGATTGCTTAGCLINPCLGISVGLASATLSTTWYSVGQPLIVEPGVMDEQLSMGQPPEYAAGYTRGYTEELRRRQSRWATLGAVGGVVVGMALGGTGWYVLQQQ